MHNKYRKIWLLALILFVTSFITCGKQETEDNVLETGETLIPTVVPTGEEVTLLLTVTPLPMPTLTSDSQSSVASSLESTVIPAPTVSLTPTTAPESTPTPLLNPDVSYLEISPEENLKVYISEDSEKPQVIVEKIVGQAVSYQVFDWNYDLEYGNPIVKPGIYNYRSDEPVLFILLPTEGVTEVLSPIGAYEICGELHMIDCSTLEERKSTDNIAPELFEKETVAEYRENEEGEHVFTLELSANGHMGHCFEYPDLELPEQEMYPVVFEKTVHFTETLLSYRRVGVRIGEEVMWLGKLCNDITQKAGWLQTEAVEWAYDYVFFPEAGQGYYASERYYDVPGGERVYSWQPLALEPDALLDLDGDGIPEQIMYRKLPNAESRYQLDATLFINGIEVHRETFRTFDPVVDYAFAAQLDGEGYQLLLLDFGNGRDCSAEIYRYKNGELLTAGYFPDIHYEMIEEDGRYVCFSTSVTHQLQNDIVERKYAFIEGVLQEVPKEYYEFLEKWRDGDGPAERNVFTVIADVELYVEKDGEETFLLPAGSHAVTLGGDLKGWMLFENRDTGEQGWMRVKCDEYGNAFACVLTNGRIADADELFEGLLVYD